MSQSLDDGIRPLLLDAAEAYDDGRFDDADDRLCAALSKVRKAQQGGTYDDD